MSTTETALAVAVEPKLVLTDTVRFETFYEQVRAKTSELKPDVSTKKGRDEIRSMARKVTSIKTGIDEHRKKLTAEAREFTNTVNAAGGVIWDRLEALAAEVRKPLTEWEEAEKARDERAEATIAKLQAAAVIRVGDTSDQLSARLAEIEAIQITDEDFGEKAPGARYTWGQATEALVAGIQRLRQEEADKAELEQLRAQQAERAQQEAAAAEAARAVLAEEERQASIAAAAEQARQAEAARAETERLEALAAAEQARLAEVARVAREHEQAMADAEAAHAADLLRLQREGEEREATRIREEQARQAEENRLAEEDRLRRENREHQARVCGAAKATIMTYGVGEETARAIVLAIAKGAIPHIKVEF